MVPHYFFFVLENTKFFVLLNMINQHSMYNNSTSCYIYIRGNFAIIMPTNISTELSKREFKNVYLAICDVISIRWLKIRELESCTFDE